MYYTVTIHAASMEDYIDPNSVGRPCILRRNERNGEVVALTRLPKLYWREEKRHSIFSSKTHRPRDFCRIEMISKAEFDSWAAMKLAPFASLIFSNSPESNIKTINLVFTDEKIKREW